MYQRVTNIVKKEVAHILSIFKGSRFFWNTFPKLPDDDKFYNTAVTAATSLVYTLYTREWLLRLGHDLSMRTQLDQIWRKLDRLKRKFCGHLLFILFHLIPHFLKFAS